MKKIKRILGLILTVLTLAVMCVSAGCEKTAPTLDKSSVTIYVFETQTISLQTESDDKITWISTNEQIISLQASGKSVKVTAVRTGEATIIAKQNDTVLRCKVTVFPTEKPFEIQLNSMQNIELAIGEKHQINATVLIDGKATDLAEIIYQTESVSPLGTITVDQNGNVTAVSKGTATIKVYAVYGDEVSSAVTVSITCFPDDYNNAGQQIPSLDGGLIEDVFGV